MPKRLRKAFRFDGTLFKKLSRIVVNILNGWLRDVLGDETLRDIAREVTARIRQSASIDWTIKETVRAAMRAMVKRLLRKYGYPPDKQEAATKLVLEQAELLCANDAA